MSIAKSKLSMRWRYWVAILGIVAVSAVVQFSLPRLGIPMAWRGMVRWLIVAVTATGSVIMSQVLPLSGRISIDRPEKWPCFVAMRAQSHMAKGLRDECFWEYFVEKDLG